MEEKHKKYLIFITLVLIMFLGFFIRTYFCYEQAVGKREEYGKYNFLLSGMDPNHHKRAIDNVIREGRHLMADPLVNYPIGGVNPNPPAFAWSTALLGIIASPFFDFDVELSTWYVFEVIPAFWAVLTIIPVYFFAREMFGRRAGLWAAFFIAIMAGNVEITTLGFSNYDSFCMFFVVCGFYFFMIALKSLENKRWVNNWKKVTDIKNGFVEISKKNKKAILYSIMAGLSIATIMLTGIGASYIFVIFLIYYLAHLILNKIRKEDSLGIAVCTITTCLTALLVPFPYYHHLHLHLTSQYLTPSLIFFGIVILTIFLAPTRDYPWQKVIPLTFGIIGVSLALLYYYFPTQWGALLPSEGYFIRTKLHTTIASLQPPDCERVILSYGIITFFSALLAVGIMAIKLPKEKWRTDYLFTIAWFAVSAYMAFSVVKFIHYPTAVIAILSGWITYELVKWLDFKTMIKTYREMKPERLRGIKSAIKIKHVVGTVFIFGLIVFPNFWCGLDAGIPFEKKKDYDIMIYRALPDFMKPKNYEEKGPNCWWFGQFGTTFPSDCWADAMWWLAEQDKELAPKNRAGFISWWDYGHWATHMGEHPTVADAYHGIEWAGNFITAQSEEQAIALITARTIEASMLVHKDKKTEAILEKYIGSEGVAEFKKMYANPKKYIPEIKAHPEKYGKKHKDISETNAKYVVSSYLLTSRLELEELVNLLHEIEMHTGIEIRYFAVDSRLFPYSARTPGVYYAPVKISDQNIEDFLSITVVGNDGIEYSPGKIPEEKKRDPDFKIIYYKLNHFKPFYNSMFYKAYIGYHGEDLGMDLERGGIPAMAGELMHSTPLPAWNLTHFRLVYRTAYWNPHKEDLVNHTEDWRVIPPVKADLYGEENKGTLDRMFRGLYQGVFIIKYYHGAYINGSVTTEDGKGIPNVRVTVFDDVNLTIPGSGAFGPGIPHGYAHTDSEGKYSLIAPFGNLTLKATNGGLANPFMLTEKRELGEKKIFVSDNQAMRIADYNIKLDFNVYTSTLNGVVYMDIDNNNMYEADKDKVMIGNITLKNETLGEQHRVKVDEKGYYKVEKIIPADYNFIFEINGTNITKELSLSANESKVFDLSIKNGIINGSLYYKDKGIEGIKISAIEKNGYKVTNLSEKDGNINLTNLIPGKYRIEIEDDRYSIENLLGELEINETNITHQISINLIDAGIITGFTKPNTTVFFTDTVGNRYRTIANSSGSFKIKLSVGKYSIYAFAIENDSFYSHLSSIDVRGDMEYKVNMEKAVKINGTTYFDKNNNNMYDAVLPSIPGSVTPDEGVLPPLILSEKEAYVSLTFYSEYGNISFLSNLDGFYQGYLPRGNYTIHAFKKSKATDKTFASIHQIKLEKNMTFDVKLFPGYELAGTVYYDINNDSLIDENETIAFAEIEIRTDVKDKKLKLNSNLAGAYSIYLPEGEYELFVTCFGYEEVTYKIRIKNENVNKNVQLVPKNTAEK